MILERANIGGKSLEISCIIADEYADAISRYQFKDMAEFNMVYQWQGRCKERSLFCWCPEDTKNLKKYLGMEE